MVSSPRRGGQDEPSAQPQERKFSRKMGLFSVNSSVAQKQSPFSLGRNSMALSGNRCRSTQKVSSRSGSLFSFCQQEKCFKTSPKEPSTPFQIQKGGNHLNVGSGKSPSPAHGTHVPFAPGSFVIKRSRLIKRGRNNGNIRFPPQGTVQKLPHLWRPRQHQLSQCGCLM